MLRVMDNMETSFVFYVKVGIFTNLEQSKISLLTVNDTGIEMLSVQHDMVVSVIFTSYSGDHLRQTSAYVLSFKEHPMNI